MLVFWLALPPVTITRPSGSAEMPGQNMSCPVSVTVRWVTTPVFGSYVAVTVWPYPPLKVSGWNAPLGARGRPAGPVRRGEVWVAPDSPVGRAARRGRVGEPADRPCRPH